MFQGLQLKYGSQHLLSSLLIFSSSWLFFSTTWSNFSIKFEHTDPINRSVHSKCTWDPILQSFGKFHEIKILKFYLIPSVPLSRTPCLATIKHFLIEIYRICRILFSVLQGKIMFTDVCLSRGVFAYFCLLESVSTRGVYFCLLGGVCILGGVPTSTY